MKKENNEQKKQRLEFTVGKVHYVVNLVAAEEAKEKLEELIIRIIEEICNKYEKAPILFDNMMLKCYPCI